MDAIDQGGSSAADAMRAAEEARRRAAEEARQAEAARRAAEQAAQLRVFHQLQADAVEASPPRSVFSSPAATATAAPPVSYALSPEQAARLAADPLGTPSPYVSAEDQKELAFLAFRMEEHGASAQQVQEAVARTRLGQIERDQQALGVVDGKALEQQGRASEQGAQAALDHYIRNVDSIYSGLAPVDREQAGYLAYLADAEAKGTTYEALLVETRTAGLSLEQALLQRQLAAAAGAPPAALAALDTRIAEARVLLDGDPAAAGQVEQLEQRLDVLRKEAELYDPNRPAGWQEQFRQDEAALQARIEAARAQLPDNSLLTRLGAAQTAYDTASARLSGQEAELQSALADYHAGIDAVVPEAQAGIEKFRADLDLAESRPDLDAALQDLGAILPTATPEELGAALEGIEALPEGEFILHRLEGADGLLASDPRLRVLSGREIGVPTGLERFAQELVLNTALVGIPSFVENQRILDAPGASAALVGEARFGRALDYVGFALTLAGPVLEGVSAVARGGRTVVEITPEMTEALRAAGYADEAIEAIALRLNRAATSTRGLSELLLTSSSDEAAELMGMMKSTLPLETYALRTVPGVVDPVRQVVERPAEVLDFLLNGSDEALAGFQALRQAGWSADDARTIMTLARNGRSVEDVTAALAAGQSLDDIVAGTLFRTVGPAEAHELSGIPQSFLSGQSIEDIAALARRRGVDIVVRDANQGLEATMAARWPKDPAAHFVFGGTEVKVASIPQQTAEGLVRFKTDKGTRVGLEILDPQSKKWVSQDLFVVHKPEGWALVPGSEVDAMPEDWWAMGGDLDLLAMVQKEGAGYGFVDPGGARDLAIRSDLNAIATVPEGLPADQVPGLIMHGDAVSYFNTARTWGPALAFTSDGKMVWLGSDDAVEYWLKLRGVSAEPYARYSEAVSWLAGRDIPYSSAAYLAGTTVGSVPEALAALTTTSEATPTVTPTEGTATITIPVLEPVPAPTPTPTPTPTP
jgi:hypothetical protein